MRNRRTNAQKMARSPVLDRIMADMKPRKVAYTLAHKTPVMALLHKHSGGHSRVIAHVPKGNPTGGKAMKNIRKYVLKGAEVHSDESGIYNGLAPDYVHKVVNHAERYVDNGVHVNGVENFWCLLKRSIKGTHVHCAPFHLFRYLDDQTFRFNERKGNDQSRFLEAVRTVSGRRLTWAKLTATEDRETKPVKKTNPRVTTFGHQKRGIRKEHVTPWFDEWLASKKPFNKTGSRSQDQEPEPET